VALLAGGAVFGVLADRAEAELVAGEAEVITMAEIQEDHERATSLAMTANVLYAAGGVAFAVGTAVWLLTDGDTAGEAALRVVPAGSGGLGLAGGGTF